MRVRLLAWNRATFAPPPHTPQPRAAALWHVPPLFSC
jgi:hypothetical protein